MYSLKQVPRKWYKLMSSCYYLLYLSNVLTNNAIFIKYDLYLQFSALIISLL